MRSRDMINVIQGAKTMKGCALLRKKFKEDLFTYCIENGILQDSFEPSNDNTSVANALLEPFVVKQDLDKTSSQSPSQISHHCCYGCGDLLEDIFCHQCTCDCVGEFPIIHQLIHEKTCAKLLAEEHEANIDTLFRHSSTSSRRNKCGIFAREKKSNGICEYFLEKVNRISFYEMPKVLSLAWETILEIELAFEDKHCQPEDILDDDDDEDYFVAVTPSLSTEEPDNSLIMGDEHLDTVLATESDEFIKSSVKNCKSYHFHHIHDHRKSKKKIDEDDEES
nr:hypothetical protein [Tanacetum cinerariifolium]